VPKILKDPTLHYVEAITGSSPTGVREIALANTQFEYRLDPDLAQLIESIRTDGQQIPVIIRGRKPPYQLICGFRRTRSIQAHGGQAVKAIILPEIPDDKAHRLSVLENEERKSLTDLDRANACRRLQEEGKTQKQIAEILKTTQDQVSRYISLLSLPEPIFGALKKGRIDTYHALYLKNLIGVWDVPYIEELIGRSKKKRFPSGSCVA
jgi:ParB/RepB/Spo0J family partition protein